MVRWCETYACGTLVHGWLPALCACLTTEGQCKCVDEAGRLLDASLHLCDGRAVVLSESPFVIAAKGHAMSMDQAKHSYLKPTLHVFGHQVISRGLIPLRLFDSCPSAVSWRLQLCPRGRKSYTHEGLDGLPALPQALRTHIVPKDDTQNNNKRISSSESFLVDTCGENFTELFNPDSTSFLHYFVALDVILDNATCVLYSLYVGHF